jgi:hypothetical protein
MPASHILTIVLLLLLLHTTVSVVSLACMDSGALFGHARRNTAPTCAELRAFSRWRSWARRQVSHTACAHMACLAQAPNHILPVPNNEPLTHSVQEGDIRETLSSLRVCVVCQNNTVSKVVEAALRHAVNATGTSLRQTTDGMAVVTQSTPSWRSLRLVSSSRLLGGGNPTWHLAGSWANVELEGHASKHAYTCMTWVPACRRLPMRVPCNMAHFVCVCWRFLAINNNGWQRAGRSLHHARPPDVELAAAAACRGFCLEVRLTD